MSIATLKKKSATIHSSHSRGPDGFSINGTLRFLGPNSTPRPSPRTPFKGAVPVGHGGGARCRSNNRAARCDSSREYPVVIHRSCNSCTPQTLVKPSALSALAYLDSKLFCCKQIVKEPPINLPYICENKFVEKQCPPFSKPFRDLSYSTFYRTLTCPNPLIKKQNFM
jgi:hypothetical protein